MNTLSRNLFIFFIIISLLHLASIAIQVDVLNYITKPLLISSLAIWFWTQAKGISSNFSLLYLLGLAFSTIGDILLMFVNSFGENFFLLGLGSFLFAHLSYIVSFVSYPYNKGEGAISRNWKLVLPYCLILILILIFLQDSLGVYKLPVFIYAFVIVTMSAFSLNMLGRTTKNGGKHLVIGALLFMVSDFTIAIKKFKYPELNEILSSLIIMATYLIGQYLMAKGAVESVREIKDRTIRKDVNSR